MHKPWQTAIKVNQRQVKGITTNVDFTCAKFSTACKIDDMSKSIKMDDLQLTPVMKPQ
jgi:hypothetical protein